MFDSLTERLTGTLKSISGQAKFSEDNIKSTLREVRMALLEADVALPVVKQFVEQVKQQALGSEVQQSLNPGQAFIKLVHQQLCEVMGASNEQLNLATQPPAIILLAGLQGAGKTTSAAKLAKYLMEREKKKVMLVSADVYRPAAIKQLETLSQEVGALFHPSNINESPLNIAQGAIDAAKRAAADVLLVDTAGRLAIDSDMMSEIKTLHAAIKPIETLFVVDSMTGQDAAQTAKAFNETLALTGVILTKTDGDARGGAALSVRQITGKPIKFLGAGEKVDALEPFHPERVASRILDMGDVLSLIEEVERKVDKQKAEKLANKIKKGKGFDLVDFLEQMQQMQNMGGLSSMMEKLPGMGGMGNMSKQTEVAEGQFKQMQAIIHSMTLEERHFPDKINGSRKKRIALGSGRQIQDVNRVLKQHKQMQKMMKKMSAKGGMRKMMQTMKNLGGGQGMPPGMPPMR